MSVSPTSDNAVWPPRSITDHQRSAGPPGPGAAVLSPEERDLVTRIRTEVADLLTRHDPESPAGTAGLSTADAPTGGGVGWGLIGQVLDRHAQAALRAGGTVLGADTESRVARAVYDSLFALGGFTPLLADPAIENIDANGCDVVWVRYADGRRARVAPVADSDADLVELVRTVAARAGEQERRFDRGVPRLSAQLADGSRLFAVMAVSRRPVVSIRRHRYPTTTLEMLQRLGTVNTELRLFLTAAVRAGKNILVAGGTNLGKTTMLRALASAIPPHERLVTIEDSYELGLDRDVTAHPNVVALQAREPNIEGEGEVTQAELVRWALRMSPDRVIVGEIRGPEVIPMCNAMSQGNDGSMATIHASDSRGVFAKLAAYAVQAPEHLPLEATNLLVASAVDFVVHLTWAEGRRVVSSIREVIDADGSMVTSNEVFRPDTSGRAVPGVPLRPATADALAEAGYDLALLGPGEGWGTL